MARKDHSSSVLTDFIFPDDSPEAVDGGIFAMSIVCVISSLTCLLMNAMPLPETITRFRRWAMVLQPLDQGEDILRAMLVEIALGTYLLSFLAVLRFVQIR